MCSRIEYMAFCRFCINSKTPECLMDEQHLFSFKAGIEYMKQLVREQEDIEKLSQFKI